MQTIRVQRYSTVLTSSVEHESHYFILVPRETHGSWYAEKGESRKACKLQL